MKILCFLLSFYVFSLSTVPCCSDDDNCKDEIKLEQTENHSQDHKEKNCTTCSPFFNCGTCSGFVFTTFYEFNFKDVFFYKDNLITEYKSQFVSGFVAAIWQPPKIS